MFNKQLNLIFILTILLLIATSSTEISNPILNTSLTKSLNDDKNDFSFIEFFKNNKKNFSETKIFDELLEEIFNSEDNDNEENSWLSSEYKNVLKNMNSNEEENYYANLIKEKQEKDSLVFISEKDNEEKLLKDFCFQEKNAIIDKIKYAENYIFNLESDQKQFKNEIDLIKKMIDSNEQSLKLKAEEIENHLKELNTLKNKAVSFNKNDNSHLETLIIIDSLISLVNSYYKNLENLKAEKAFENINNYDNNNNKESKNFASNLMQIIGKAEKIKDYSLSTFLSEVVKKHLNEMDTSTEIANSISLIEYKSEIKNKILEALEKIKMKYEEKQKEIKTNAQSEMSLKEMALENNKKYVELLNEEIAKYKNDFRINQQRTDTVDESLSASRNNFMRLNELAKDLNKICN